MTDKKKAIKGLEAMREFFGFGLPSQSPTFEAYQNILTDAIAMLKEQELVRCKDCKHHLECDYWLENGNDWFCADGERQ